MFFIGVVDFVLAKPHWHFLSGDFVVQMAQRAGAVQVQQQPEWKKFAEGASSSYELGKRICIIDTSRPRPYTMIFYHIGEGEQCRGVDQTRYLFISGLSQEDRQRFYQIFQQKRVCTCRGQNLEFEL